MDELLTRGVANIIPNKEELKKVLAGGKKLNVYLGIDPTATKIHLGHAVLLRKLNEFAKLGHNVTFLIGDFTAMIGDSSDKNTERPLLNRKQVEENFKTYQLQAEKILNFKKINIKYNSEWLDTLDFKRVLQLCLNVFSVNEFISRELIKKRLAEGARIGLQELLYPVMQGYDSYHLETDIQIGGTDQTFNMQTGRALRKHWANKESFILATEFLMGTDGRKMSKSWGNAIWLDDAPRDMFTKVMAIQDDLIDSYLTLGTNKTSEEIKEIKSGKGPMDIKKELAKIIVSELHSQKDALIAEDNFKQTVQGEKLPDDIPVFQISVDNKQDFVNLLVETKLAASRSDAKRLIEQSGVAIDDKIVNVNEQPSLEENSIIRVGKRKFVKIKITR